MALWLTIVGVIFFVFRSWLGFDLITSGDLSYFYKEQIQQYLNPPFFWETFRNAGLGGRSFLHQGVYLYNLPMGFLGQYFDYGVIQRIIWFFPILIVGFLSPIILAKEVNLFPRRFYPLASLIFFLNTYFLMIMGGGQLTVALAYIMVPLIFALFLRALRVLNRMNVILFSLALSILIAWDFRLAYISLGLLFFYFIFFWQESLSMIKKYFFIFFWAGIILLGFHAFWLLPFVLNYNNPVTSFSSAYTTSKAVQFLSFAQFSDSLSLLHPNWPENIFGKTYFMRPEFLLLPMVAYLSLLFISKSKAKILFFAIVGLIGSFLAKGANPPLGGVYVWLFEHFPGMIMFRDPTKWYLLVALSYSILIPYSLFNISEWINKRLKIKMSNLIMVVFILFWLFIIRQAILGQLGGVFKTTEVPKDYLILKDFLVSQPEFFRTFWIPQKQRFGFYSDDHPAVDGQEFFKVANSSVIIEKLKEEKPKEILAQAGVKYVILPFDSEEEIFLKDRKYNPEERLVLEKELDQIPWLKKIFLTSSIAVYETPSFRGHFWVDQTKGQAPRVDYRMINPTKYSILVKNQTSPATLVFSENFDPGWVAKIAEQEVASQKTYDRFNSFPLKRVGDYEISVEFTSQKYLHFGLVISMVTFLVPVGLLIVDTIKLGKIHF